MFHLISDSLGGRNHVSCDSSSAYLLDAMENTPATTLRKRRVRFLWFLLAITSPIWGLVLLETVLAGVGYPLGNIRARWDVYHGHYELKGSFGLPEEWARKNRVGRQWHWMRNYSALVQERHGIRIRYFPSCMVSMFGLNYDRGYDGVQRAAIEKKFGAEALLDCAREVPLDFPIVQSKE